MDRGDKRDLLEQPRDEALSEHELREHGQFDIVPESARGRSTLTQQQRVEEAFDLTRVALRTARQDGANLVTEGKRVVRLLGLLAERRLDGRRIQTATGPRTLQLLTRHANQVRIVGVVFTDFGAGQQQRDVNPCLGLAQRRDTEWDLDELFEVVACVVPRSGAVRQIGKVLAHRILDHRLVGRDDERCPGGEHEQPDRFERFDGGVWQAAIEVIDQDDELFDPRVLQELVEGLAERFHFLGHILCFARLQHGLHLVDRRREVFFRGELGRIRHHRFERADDSSDLIGCRNACERGQGEAAGSLRHLQPVDAPEDILDRGRGLVQGRTLLDQARDDPLDQGDLGILEALKAPSVELEAQDFVLVGEPRLDHFEHAGLARTPVAMHADRHRMVGPGAKQLDDRGRDGLVVQQVDPGFVVGQNHRR